MLYSIDKSFSFLIFCFYIKVPDEELMYLLTCKQLDLIVVENILAFSEGFWVRLAARIDLCKSDDDKVWLHICVFSTKCGYYLLYLEFSNLFIASAHFCFSERL